MEEDIITAEIDTFEVITEGIQIIFKIEMSINYDPVANELELAYNFHEWRRRQC